MNILVVTHNLPLPTWGAGIRNYHLLAALARRHRVTLFALVDDLEEASADLARLRPVTPDIDLFEVRPGPSKRRAQLRAALSGRSYLMTTFSPAEAQRKLQQLVAARDSDLVLFESILVAGLRPPRDGRKPLKVVIDQHNVEHAILRRTFEVETSPAKKWYNWAEYRALRQRELDLCRDADGVVCTSDRDLAGLRQLTALRASAVVPNGVDIEGFLPADPAARIPGRVIFTGTMGYYPNVQSVLLFAEQCWPAIRAARPDATWEIVGSHPPAEVLALAALPGVTVTGAVADVRPHLAAASVAIAPLLIGGGTRLKILEAFATGTPMVSTRIGCEGLAVVPGESLLVEDDPSAFAEAVVRVLTDAPLRARLALAGRAVAESTYGWARCGDQLLAFIDSLSVA
jgi:sugar transferase (PEP-CTERM/EpsH1 system associated)